MNPNRECGMCALFDLQQPKMEDLLAALPDPKECMTVSDFGETWNAALINETLPVLRKVAGDGEVEGGCPACILAALRQKGIPVPASSSFHFKKECEFWWDEFNREQRDQMPNLGGGE